MLAVGKIISHSCVVFFLIFIACKNTYTPVHAMLSIPVLLEHFVFPEHAFSISGKNFQWVELHT